MRDNYGTININGNGRPRNNPHESLGEPFSIRLYENEKENLKERIYESGLSKNQVIRKCLQIGLFSWDYLDWIFNNMDTIQGWAETYNRKTGPRNHT